MTRWAVRREPSYVEDGGRSFFAWYHEAPEAEPRDCVAVICGPTGYEYTRAHRSVRHLADRFARAGIPAVRFDYHGIGDSPGTDLDPDRLATWQANVARAIAFAREASGRERVCLVGVRLGGSLALMAAQEAPVDSLVLWNACLQGRGYLRELQAIAMTAAQAPSGEADGLEAAGFVLSAETMAAIKALDLRKALPRAARVLVAHRDDASSSADFARHLAASGIACDEQALPGWAGMMAEHQFTVVPDAALERIVAWVREGTAAAPQREASASHPAAQGANGRVPGLRITVDDEHGAPIAIEEALCQFGAERHLFGVLARPDAEPGRTAILMFNAGSAHHVGPNRIYVTLARGLAALGFACLRFDLESLGDSVLRGDGRENYPYPDNATADARAAIEYLKGLGYRDFVALGLCSGAHTAFHAGLALDGPEIRELVMINPMSFYWREGDSLNETAYFTDAKAYRQSMRDPSRWLKLLRGDVNFRRLSEVALTHTRTMARSYYDALCETLLPARAPRLSQDLRRLIGMKRRVTLMVAEGDPGREILMAGAKRTATRALKAGQLRLETIPGADHTFSRSRTRSELVARLSAHLRSSATLRSA